MEIVLLHGFAQSARSWDCVASLLAERTGAAVHAYEFPGHGDRLQVNEESTLLEFPRHGMTALADDAFAYDMDAVCDGLLSYLASFDEPPVVVGYSMGGRIAMAALCRWLGRGCETGTNPMAAAGRMATAECVVAAERTAAAEGASLPMRALVLESAGLGLCDEAAREAAKRRNAEWAAMLRTEGVESFMDYWETLPLFASQKNLPEEARKRIREGRLANDAEALARTLEGSGAHRMPLRDEVDEALVHLVGEGVPLLCVAGGLDAKYATVAESVSALFAEVGCVVRDRTGSDYANGCCAESSAACAEMRVAEHRDRRVETVVIPGCGHNVHEENPAAYVEALASFLGA